MLRLWDLFLIPLTLLPGLLTIGFRIWYRTRGGTTAGYQAIITIAGLLIFGPAGYALAVIIPRLDALDASPSAGMPLFLGAMVGAPVIALLFMLWQAYYADKLVRKSEWTLWQYLGLNLRFLLLILLPMLLIGGVVIGLSRVHAIRTFFTNLNDIQAATLAVAGVMLLMAALQFLLMPLLLKWMLKTKPLHDDGLRARLTALGDRLGVPISDLRLMANPGAKIANALVTGFSKRQRAVILTDEALNTMTPEEIEAIFAHECGHIHHRHLWVRLGLQMGGMVVLGVVGGLVGNYLGNKPGLFVAAVPLLMLLPTFAMSPILRRQEFQADQYAGRQTDPLALATALEKLEAVNLGPRKGRMPRWLQWMQQHPLTDQRIARLRAMAQ